MKKATLLLALCLIVLLTLPVAGAAIDAVGRGVTVLVDGAAPESFSNAYITDEGVTMVPLRALAEALGFSVRWDQETRTVSVISGPADAARSAVVVLDPGHGGLSTGAGYGGAAEKDLNLSIASQAAALLEEAGLTVYMTRSGDEDVDLYERTVMAAEWEADLFVSVHCNASVIYPDAEGIYTAAFSEDTPGWTLAETLRETMMAATGAGDMGTEARPNLAVLRTAQVPAALVECGYMSTPAELEKLVQPDYQAKLARGIADGVLAYLEQESAPGRILE